MTSALYEAISRWGAIEWARAGTSLQRPPFLAWRFRSEAHRGCDALVEVVERFHGAVRWGGYRSGRNWVIEPRPVTVFSSVAEFRTDIEMSDAFAKHHPELVLAAHADVPGLAEHIRCGVASPET